MGACNFEVQQREATIRSAYKSAVSEALEECGHDSYNGTISTTSGFKDYSRKFKNSRLDLNAFIDKYFDDTEKWGDCIGICINEPQTNKNKVKSKVDHMVTKGAKKWETVYVVYDQRGNELVAKNKKGDAVKEARKYCEVNQATIKIDIEKRLVGGNNQVSRITYKKSKGESLGTYVFFGWAAE